MQDAQLVGAIAEGDRQGWAELYERYADPLYTYCVSQLQDRDAAADVLHDTLIVAAERVTQLRDPERLRPWLYAIARNECHRRRRGHRRLVALEEAGDLPEAGEDVDSGLRLDEMRQLVRDTLAGLNPGEREVLELAGQHGLAGPDLAAALGVSVNHANALLSRARQQFEKSLSALVVARTGREACAVLDDLLHGWDGRMTPLLRKRIARHIESCDTCGENKRRRVNAKQLLAMIPLLVAGGEITDQVTQENDDPELVSYRRGLADRAGPYRRDGFPVGQSRMRRPPWITIAAVAALLLMLGIYALIPHAADRREALPPTPSTSSAGSLPATVSVSVPDSITTTVDTTTVAPATTTTIRIAAPPPKPVVVTTTTTTTQPPSSSNPPSSSSQPPSSSNPPVGTFGVTPREVNLNSGKAAVTLSAKGGALSWGWNSTNQNVTVTPLSGGIAADRSVSVTISLNAPDNSGRATVTFTASNAQTVTVSASWSVIS
ncbi:sigma-70 family RNA polymerase sigma factor [Kutzneria sp. NPDC052558]|uniref:sigma-70 family RNA polymerase sigma factor n=1 Tax=Kutzneria sp. NPDC052558 TaxID=3364121 RepID=UPI0037C98894